MAGELITGMADQGEPVDDVNLDFLKAFDSVCHGLLVKKIEALEIHLKKTRWVEEFIRNNTLRVKLGGHLSSKGIVKSGVPLGPVLEGLLFLNSINSLSDELVMQNS